MRESTKQYLNSKYGIESAETDNFINSPDFLDYINNDTKELYHNYFYNNSKYYSGANYYTSNKIYKITKSPHYTPAHIRRRNDLLNAIGTIAVMILFILILILAFISLPT